MNEHAMPMPAYDRLHAWELYSSEMKTEKQQTIEEGKDIHEFEKLFDAIAEMPRCAEKARLADILYELIVKAPQRADYAYNEPSELEAIRALRPAGAGEKKPLPSLDVLKDKLAGAWYGRVAGCSLGKPVEGIRTNEFEPFLKETGNWPMHRFILSADVTDDMKDKYKFPLRERSRWMVDQLSGAPADDDTNYTVLAQLLINRFGRDFTPANMIQFWLDMQPKNAYCTAERVAFTNAVKGYLPPDTARFQNPYREWIGAQIRGDYFGYINPGDPVTAADMAWRDASISHVKNGIYGEMFAAAMISALRSCGDLRIRFFPSVTIWNSVPSDGPSAGHAWKTSGCFGSPGSSASTPSRPRNSCQNSNELPYGEACRPRACRFALASNTSSSRMPSK